MKLFHRLMRWGNVLTVLATLLAYLAPALNPSYFWFFGLPGLAYPWLLMLNFLFVIYWLFNKKKYFLFSFITIIMGWNYLNGFIGMQCNENAEGLGNIAICSYNISGFRKIDKKNEAKPTSEVNLVKFFNNSADADIFCFQESGIYADKIMKKNFSFPYIHRHSRLRTAIYSTLPIKKTGEFNFDDTFNSAIWIDLNIDGVTHRIYNIHLQSNQISSDAAKLRRNGSLQNKETWSGIKDIFVKHRYFTRKRAAQAQEIAKHISLSPYPVIVCGDFNDPPLSYAYATVRDGLKNAFQEAGCGFGTTYNGSIPALGIDHILVPPSAEVHKHEIFKVPFSDHLPIYAEITLK